MTREAIVLAGGLGTRLRSEVADRPKVLAEVNGKPFLHYVLKYLNSQGLQDVVLSVGYMGEMVEEVFGDSFEELNLMYCYEEEPMGTGGGIQLALEWCDGECVTVVNGDTIFPVNIQEMFEHHESRASSFTVALKRLQNFDRYGTVVTDEDTRIIAFEEKKALEEGLINGGVYMIDREMFMALGMTPPYSLEQDYFEPKVSEERIFGFESDAYFLDIGIPEDYKRAQDELG